jgi:predicted permease
METIARDLQFAVRSLAKSKVFTAVAIASLALGIGANTAVFSLVKAFAFPRLPYAEPERLVDLHEWSATQLCAGCGVGTSYPGFREWRESARSFSGMAAYLERPFAVSGAEGPDRIGGAVASAELSRVLGVSPMLGRWIRPEEDRIDGARVVVLSDALWQRRYAGDRRVIGQVIRINGIPHTVIGVMPPRFKYPEFAELWVPLTPNVQDGPRSQRDFGVIARLRPDATVGQADAEMRRIAKSIEDRFPETQREWSAGATELRRELWSSSEGTMYTLLLGAVGFVLLIVCANVTGLLLSRGASRRKEIAIRLALGATRRQIVRHLLVESLLLALGGAVAGSVIAAWGVDVAEAAVRTPLPFWIEFRVDWLTLAYCGTISILTGFLFGLLPALRSSAPDVQTALKDGSSGITAGIRRSHLRAALVVGELSMALVLLAGAGAMMKTFLRISAREVGLDTRNVLQGRVEFLDARYRDTARLASTISQLTERVGSIPGAVSAAARRTEFIAGFGRSDVTIRAEGLSALPPNVSPRFYEVVTPSYLETVGLPLVAGRSFTRGDRAGAPLVALINQRLAEQLWPRQSPLGRRIKLGPDSLPWLTIVGVVGDRVANQNRVMNYAYVPFDQRPGASADIFIRAKDRPLALTRAIRAEAATVDSDLPLLDLQTVDQARRRNYWAYEMFAIFMAVLAGLAILLAAVGLYGVVAYNAVQRTREIGIRVALGANTADIIRMVTAQGGRLAVLGVVIGAVGAAAVVRVMRSTFIGANPVDPIVLGLVSALLVVVALAASYLPARAASRVDPLHALRSE